MFYLGILALVFGGAAIVGGLVLWALTEFEHIGKRIAFYGLVAALFGSAPVLILTPATSKVSTVVEAAAKQIDEPAIASFDLKLHKFTCSEDYGFAEVNGQVTNVSDHPIHNVMAHGTFTASNGDVINTASALIAFQPIMPGQTSSFKVIANGNPLIRKCGVQIGTLFGGTLAVER